MTSSYVASWTIVHQEDTNDHASDLQSLRNALEKGNEDTKIQTMQKMLVIMLNGDPLPGLLMHVIRFVHTSPLPYRDIVLTFGGVGYAEQKQTSQEVASFLLGDLSKDESRWEIETGDDSCMV